MRISRRDLLKMSLKASAGAAVISSMPGTLLAHIDTNEYGRDSALRDPIVKELALRAVEAAVGAGATYADVRLTHTRRREIAGGGRSPAKDFEGLVVGVRSLVNGYWGFASSRIWDVDEVVRLGTESVAHARALAGGPIREVDLAPVSVPVDDHWTMPVDIDPFEISPFEVSDYLSSLTSVIHRHSGFVVQFNGAVFNMQDKAFASSEGGYCTQRLYLTQGTLVIGLTKHGKELKRALDTLSPAGLGWELYKKQPLREQIRRLMEEMEEDLVMPVRPVEVGRYSVVADARTIANLVGPTIGAPTQLDRMYGYEANSGGTSFLTDPIGMLENYEFGAPTLTVMANRSEHGGAATVRWDDEGVQPDEFTVIRNGIINDFQTTRESAMWLSGAYANVNRALRSHGCAVAPTAVEAPLTHTPNLILMPGHEAADFDDLISGLEEGLAVKDMQIDTDYQGMTGLGLGRVYEVKNGKRVALVTGAGILFRTTDLWKGMVALGGEGSIRRYGYASRKGEPEQTVYFSVSAPCAAFKDLTVIDYRRKA